MPVIPTGTYYIKNALVSNLVITFVEGAESPRLERYRPSADQRWCIKHSGESTHIECLIWDGDKHAVPAGGMVKLAKGGPDSHPWVLKLVDNSVVIQDPKTGKVWIAPPLDKFELHLADEVTASDHKWEFVPVTMANLK